MRIALALTLTCLASSTALAADTAAANPPLCVSPRLIRETRTLSDNEILFIMTDGKQWLNTLPAKCPGLKFEGGFKWVIHGDSICANMQSFTVLRRGTPCMLGAFTAYTPPPAK